MNDGRDLDKLDIWMDTFFDKNFKRYILDKICTERTVELLTTIPRAYENKIRKTKVGRVRLYDTLHQPLDFKENGCKMCHL